MLEKVKLSLRISNDAFNDEILGIIEAAKEDLIIGGVSEEKANSSDDPLILRAVTLYAKANFGLSNPDSEKYDDSYHNLREKLALSGRHNVSQ